MTRSHTTCHDDPPIIEQDLEQMSQSQPQTVARNKCLASNSSSYEENAAACLSETPMAPKARPSHPCMSDLGPDSFSRFLQNIKQQQSRLQRGYYLIDGTNDKGKGRAMIECPISPVSESGLTPWAARYEDLLRDDKQVAPYINATPKLTGREKTSEDKPLANQSTDARIFLQTVQPDKDHDSIVTQETGTKKRRMCITIDSLQDPGQPAIENGSRTGEASSTKFRQNSCGVQDIVEKLQIASNLKDSTSPRLSSGLDEESARPRKIARLNGLSLQMCTTRMTEKDPSLSKPCAMPTPEYNPPPIRWSGIDTQSQHNDLITSEIPKCGIQAHSNSRIAAEQSFFDECGVKYDGTERIDQMKYQDLMPEAMMANVSLVDGEDMAFQSLPPQIPRTGFPAEFWDLIPPYLSSREIRNLRLVNRQTADELAPYIFRSSVIRFGPKLFSLDGDEIDQASSVSSNTMLRKHGSSINKFGISFEYELAGLVYAPAKIIQKTVHAWFGSYIWPLEIYPRFASLKKQEDLISDNRWLLKDAMKQLTRASELALSIDSGHGWLNGADISDLAIWKMRQARGTRVFGKTFDACDKMSEDALRQYFRWAQLNSLELGSRRIFPGEKERIIAERQRIQETIVKEYDEYLCQSDQAYSTEDLHLGTVSRRRTAMAHPLGMSSASITRRASHDKFTNLPRLNLRSAAQSLTDSTAVNALSQSVFADRVADTSATTSTLPSTANNAGSNIIADDVTLPSVESFGNSRLRLISKEGVIRDKRTWREPQWPIIFNGYNLAADVGGDHENVQKRVARPADFPLRPGQLTESQAQWLMEILWAQASFLAAYTGSVIDNKDVLKNVHSLHLAKISSNLLSSLEQTEFWSSLRNLRTITLFVIPDWRREHVPGDKFFSTNMLINPVESSVRLAHLLQKYIAPLENVSTLTTGFVGGGEHATGIFARNNHVLPAPITLDPRQWLSDHEKAAESSTMFTFNHVRVLKFQNCWFSPYMLESFVHASRDTSLHHLILDSVSLTGRHNDRRDGPLMTDKNLLACDFEPDDWMFENIVPELCWIRVLENITPGKAIMERKAEEGVLDEDEIHAAEAASNRYRGNIRAITFDSCGYVQIKGIDASDFAQNGLVVQSGSSHAFDDGLRVRCTGFTLNESSGQDTNNIEIQPTMFPSERMRSYPNNEIFEEQREDEHEEEEDDDDFDSDDDAVFAEGDGNGGDNENNENNIGPDGLFIQPPAPPHPRARQQQRQRRLQQRRLQRQLQRQHQQQATSSNPTTTTTTELMMSTKDPQTKKPYFGLGKLTSCIHPVEKRILEQAWSFRFGWGDTMDRWGAVEDGCVEGGTGRFSGVIRRE